MRLPATLALALLLPACTPTAEPSAVGQPANEPQAAAAPAAATPTATAALPTVTVYKTATCGCCRAWVTHLEANGFAVEAVDVDDLSARKEALGVPQDLASCHTAVVDGYVVEGHVPADDVKRLLTARPDVRGLAVPGMPIGSPGMEVEGQPAQPYAVVAFSGDERGVFARH